MERTEGLSERQLGTDFKKPNLSVFSDWFHILAETLNTKNMKLSLSRSQKFEATFKVSKPRQPVCLLLIKHCLVLHSPPPHRQGSHLQSRDLASSILRQTALLTGHWQPPHSKVKHCQNHHLDAAGSPGTLSNIRSVQCASGRGKVCGCVWVDIRVYAECLRGRRLGCSGGLNSIYFRVKRPMTPGEADQFPVRIACGLQQRRHGGR